MLIVVNVRRPQKLEACVKKGDNGKFGFTHTDGLINIVVDGSSADKANIEVGDLIFAINGKRPSENENIYSLMKNRETGDFVKLNVYRKGDKLLLKI